MKGEKGIGGAVTATDGLSEELTDEAFTNQLPAGLITADGQQQNVMVYTTSYQQVLYFFCILNYLNYIHFFFFNHS